MKQLIPYIFLSLLTITGITGCKKNNERPRTAFQTNPFKAYIEERGFLPVELALTSRESFEIGYRFTVIRNQEVSKLGALMPRPGQYVVTLWRFDNESVIAQATVNVSDKEFYYTDISGVNLEPRVDYVLSVNSTSNGVGEGYFAQRLADEPYPFYPFQLGIMSITALVMKHSEVSVFPNAVYDEYQYYLMGIPDMHFK